jgi:hypothetical protein
MYSHDHAILFGHQQHLLTYHNTRKRLAVFEEIVSGKRDCFREGAGMG